MALGARALAVILVGSIGATVFVSAPLDAAPNDASFDRRSEARRLFNEAIDLRTSGDLHGALAKFEAADATFSTPKTRLEVGRANVALGRFVRGATVLRSVAGVAYDAGEAAKYGPVLKEAAALAAETEKRIAHLRIETKGDVDELAVDGASVSEPAGTSIGIDPGMHRVSARVKGIREERTIEAAEGALVEVSFGGEGDTSGAASASTFGRRSPLPLPLVIGGGVVVVIGGVLALSAKKALDDSNSDGHCGIGGVANACDEEGRGLRSTAGTRANLATAAFVVGGAAVATGVVLWLVTPNADKGMGVSFGVGPGTIAVNGAF